MTETNRTATARWKRFRQTVIRSAPSDPTCHWCATPLNPGAARGEAGAIEIDHLRPVITHPWLEYDRENVVLACHPCNRRKGKRAAPDQPEAPTVYRTFVTHRRW